MASTTACQENPDQWFSNDHDDLRAAKAACKKCPIREQCEELGWEQVHGVWGGLSEWQRMKLDPARYLKAKARAEKLSTDLDHAIGKQLSEVQQFTEDPIRTLGGWGTGHSAKEIAAKLGVSSRTVVRRRKELGLSQPTWNNGGRELSNGAEVRAAGRGQGDPVPTD